MKIFGYHKKYDDDVPIDLSEVTFAGDTAAIRAVAQFLIRTADRMDQYGLNFCHEHLCDADPEWPTDYPDVIVARPAESSPR
ncbi:MAG: hypothetical protein ABGZ53_28750 [Fuerstiella sp.]|jgi:hypothetical protein|nr:hypothetical protein [Fuerstiella sp.]